MRIEPAPLQLEGYYLKSVSCGIRAGLEQETKLAMVAGLHIQPDKVVTASDYRIDLKVETGKNIKEPNRYRIQLKIASDETQKDLSPYVFSLTLIGFFRWEESKERQDEKSNLTKAALDILITRNAAMILYSTAREILASLTNRGPLPGIVLPAFSFIVDDDMKALTAHSAKATPRAITPKPRRAKPSSKTAKKK